MTRKILLAEDSITIRKVFELTFQHSGVAITTVDNGEDAVRLAGELSPDLVIADVSLPGKDGFQVASEVKALPFPAPIPVLVLAGSIAPFDEERFRASGADGVVFKPFEAQQLFDRVESILRDLEAPAPRPEVPEAPAGTEEVPAPGPPPEAWDFSDVMEEVEQATAQVPAEGPPGSVPEPAPPAEPEGARSLADYDLTLEELEGEPPGPAEPVAAEAEPPPAEETAEPLPPVDLGSLHPPEPAVEELFDLDAPPAVTDLGPALGLLGEDLSAGYTDAGPAAEEFVSPDAGAAPGWARLEEEPPAAPPEEPFAETAEPGGEEETLPLPETPVAPVLREEELPAAAPEESAGEAAPPAGEPLHPFAEAAEDLREQFSERAQEIFERVAAETVERVMWETMEKLTAEFSARVREAVEAAAWDVIPSTAEALIREEIARIRRQAGKKPT